MTSIHLCENGVTTHHPRRPPRIYTSPSRSSSLRRPRDCASVSRDPEKRQSDSRLELPCGLAQDLSNDYLHPHSSIHKHFPSAACLANNLQLLSTSHLSGLSHSTIKIHNNASLVPRPTEDPHAQRRHFDQKKRKAASELVEENTPTNCVRLDLKLSGIIMELL